MALRFEFSPTDTGGYITLLQTRTFGARPVAVAEWWGQAEERLLPVLRYLRRLHNGGVAKVEGDGLVLPLSALVEIPTSLAEIIGLPAVAPLSIGLTMRGKVQDADGEIVVGWTDGNYRRLNPRRNGMFVAFDGTTLRLTAQLYRLLDAVDAYNSSRGDDGDARIAAWVPVQTEVDEISGAGVTADTLLRTFRIFQAGAFALDVKQAIGGPDFDPIPMAPGMRSSLDDNADAPEGGANPEGDNFKDQTDHALLTPEHQRQFLKSFAAGGPTRPSYVIGRGAYLVLEPDLRVALDVVARMRRAPEGERRAFLRNPRPYIARQMPDGGEEVGTLFVETTQYSERVRGLGIWEKPKLDWLKGKPAGWLPEGFVLVIGTREVPMDEERLERLVTAIDEAEAKRSETVRLDGEIYDRRDASDAIDRVRALGEEKQSDYAVEPAPEPDTNVLLVDDNIGETGFVASVSARPLAAQKVFPRDLVRTEPKPHQSTGFGWLVDTWTSGLPGALLADDMGLGKTLQALAFLAWFRDNRRVLGAGGKRFAGPILIVAPTALLRNWQQEADRHLEPGAMGDCVEAFGSRLAQLKLGAGVTPEDALDVAQLRAADWILTTYETLATYHRAFARIYFPVVLFDEMQKIKAPDTINTHAAKVMNADFVVGMTGTPIENRIEDMWCLMDRVVPGRLGGLKDFSKTYGGEDEGPLRALKALLDKPQGKTPALMLRRMKQDHLKGLPERDINPHRNVMPVEQAASYDQVVAKAKAGGRSHGEVLKAIHALRGVSLHPRGADGLDPYDEASRRRWIGESARVMQTIDVLRTIKVAGEKALVFIEDLAVQAKFAAVAAAEFNLLAEPDIINGGVPGERRQDIVERFQKSPPGFGLLVLSPKAAGIGLTITAANHVIHLSRWWNPAVEDQCNDRVYRIGQEKRVSVHIPMAVHPRLGDASFDVRLNELLDRKRALSRDMLTPPVSDGDAATLFGGSIDPA